MANSHTARETTRRISLFSTDARIFPEELSGLLRRMTAGGHRVRCYAPSWPDHVARLALMSGAETDTYPVEVDETWRLMPQRALRQKRQAAIANWRPDIVVTVGPAASVTILPEVSTPGIDRIAILDHWALAGEAPDDLNDDRIVDGDALAELAASADRIICHTAHDASRLSAAIERRRRDGPQIVTLPGYGIDVAHLAADPLDHTEGDALTFLLTAPLDHWKGVRDYAAAAAIVRTEDDRHRFRIQAAPGRTSDAVPLDEILSSGHLEPVDASEGLVKAMMTSDVLVVAAHHDGMPRELLHALALGRPVIAADLPGTRAAIDEPVNGVWFEPGNPGALARAIARLVRRPDLLPAMSRAARLKAERRFDDRVVLKRYLDLLGLDT